MQYSHKEYNPEKHDRFQALTVKQPYANELITVGRVQDDGTTFGIKSIELRSKITRHRGELLICSSLKPLIPGLSSGCTLGFVDLYDIKPVSEFTAEDWKNTRIPQEKIDKIKGGYGWFMRNPRRVIEYPIKGQLGVYNLIYTKDDIITYPQVLTVDKEAIKILNDVDKWEET